MNMPSSLLTEFDFTLPRGLVTKDGAVHRQGRMRLTTAADEFAAQNDRRVQELPSYGTLALLSQVITRLGDLSHVTPDQLERLFSTDLAYLREVYNRLNLQGNLHIPAQCPHCSTAFEVELVPPGESSATPQTSFMRR